MNQLAPAARVAGIQWNLVLVEDSTPIAVDVPDGTILVSSGLVRQLTDPELVALLVHEIGHERYGHHRTWFDRNSASHQAGVVVWNAMAGVMASGGLLAPASNLPAPAFGDPFERRAPLLLEIEANCAALAYLGRLNITPDHLFDALDKLSPQESSGSAAATVPIEFATLHAARKSAAILGRMLDTGAIVNELPYDSATH
jgi:hypothetical protein